MSSGSRCPHRYPPWPYSASPIQLHQASPFLCEAVFFTKQPTLVCAPDLRDDPNEHFQKKTSRHRVVMVTNMSVPHISLLEDFVQNFAAVRPHLLGQRQMI